MKFSVLFLFLFFSCVVPNNPFTGSWQTDNVPSAIKRLGAEKIIVSILQDSTIDMSFVDKNNTEKLGFSSTWKSKSDSSLYLQHSTAYSFSLPNGTKIKLLPDSTFDIRGIKLQRKSISVQKQKHVLVKPTVNTKYKKIVVKNIQVVDAIENKVSEPIDILIVDGIIKKIQTNIHEPNAEIVYGTGKYATPTLWDMHAHYKHMSSPELTMPLFIAAGVTNIRLMKTEFYGLTQDKIEQWKSEIKKGETLGPNIVEYTTFQIHGSKKREPLNPKYFTPSTKYEVKQLFLYLSERNYKAIKMYGKSLTKNVYHEILKQAIKHRIRVVGHKPSTVTTLEAVYAGQKSIEHGHFLIQAGYRNEQKQSEQYNAYYNKQIKKRPKSEDVLEYQDLNKLNTIIAQMAKHQTWLVPTLITRKFDAFAGTSDYLKDPRLEYIYPRLKRNKWLRELHQTSKNKKYTSGYYTRYYERSKSYTFKAFKAGVNIMAGTDANDSFCFPGSGIIDELNAFIEAGFSPAEALRTATINPAKYMNMEYKMGSIEIGKKGELIITDQNPLDNLNHLKKPEYVLFNQSVYSKTDLHEMLSSVKSNVSKLK